MRMLSSRPVLRRKARWLVAAAATAVAATGLIPLTASPAGALTSTCQLSPDKCYSFTMSASPATPNTGQQATYTGVLSNLSRGGDGVQLGSANVTLPSDFYYVQVGTVSPAGSESITGSTVQLRNLSAPPGTSVTFTFQASSRTGGTFSFPSAAKQANNFSGVGNDLTLYGGDPSVTVSAQCSNGVGAYDGYGCNVISEQRGGTTSTSALDSNGNPSQVHASITYQPIAVLQDRLFASEIRSDLDAAQCPILLSVPCSFVVSVVNKIPNEYTIGRDAVSVDIDCSALCSSSVAHVWYAYNDATQTQTLLLPCSPLGPLADPLTGSYACIDDHGDGTATVQHLTYVDDYKIMSFSI
jgi:hypothetical protein